VAFGVLAGQAGVERGEGGAGQSCAEALEVARGESEQLAGAKASKDGTASDDDEALIAVCVDELGDGDAESPGDGGGVFAVEDRELRRRSLGDL